jgi:hypothetical protein
MRLGRSMEVWKRKKKVVVHDAKGGECAGKLWLKTLLK